MTTYPRRKQAELHVVEIQERYSLLVEEFLGGCGAHGGKYLIVQPLIQLLIQFSI